jgi:hypothetical protein
LSIPGSDVRQPSWGPFMDWLSTSTCLPKPLYAGWNSHFWCS